MTKYRYFIKKIKTLCITKEFDEEGKTVGETLEEIKNILNSNQDSYATTSIEYWLDSIVRIDGKICRVVYKNKSN